MVLDDYYRRIDSADPLSVVELFVEDVRCCMVIDGVVARAESKTQWEELVRARPPERKDVRHVVLARFRDSSQESVAGIVVSPAGPVGSFMSHAVVDGRMIKRYSMIFTSETQLFPAELFGASDQV